MAKALLYLSLIAAILTSCEDIYHPAIDIVQGHLIVESLITNDPNQNYVHLTKGTSFYSLNQSDEVTGATVNLIDGGGKIIRGSESNAGNFHFDLVPVTGQDYKLQILFNNDTYESEPVTMPPLPSVTKFYTERIERTEYQNDGFGNPVPVKVIARELYLDAPNTPALSNYRFGMRSILEWYYTPPLNGPSSPPVFGWLSVFYTKKFTLAGPKKFSQSDLIEKQPLVTLKYGTEGYILPDSTFTGWIFILDQYGTSAGSYDYHEKLNSQFSANGTLFDPIQTQVTGNISCKTNPSKKVYGYFDLNSYRQYRYYLYFTDPTPEGSVTQREITRYPYIPDEGLTAYYPPAWWE